MPIYLKEEKIARFNPVKKADIEITSNPIILPQNVRRTPQREEKQ